MDILSTIIDGTREAIPQNEDMFIKVVWDF